MKPDKCRCGADARIRNKGDYIWVECKKKCGMASGFVHNGFDKKNNDACINHAINLWNRMVSKNG